MISAILCQVTIATLLHVSISNGFDLDNVTSVSASNLKNEAMRAEPSYRYGYNRRRAYKPWFPSSVPYWNDYNHSRDRHTRDHSYAKRDMPRTPNYFNDAASVDFIPKVHENCRKSLSFCGLTENYPTAYIDKLITNKTNWVNIVDEIPANEEVGNRFGDDSEFPTCRAKECVIYPKVAKNKEDNWVFILNNNNYKQGVRVEICLNEYSKCEFTSGFPNEVKFLCTQKYIYRELLGLSYSGNQEKQKVKMPSCCSCSIYTPESAKKLVEEAPLTAFEKAQIEKCQF